MFRLKKIVIILVFLVYAFVVVAQQDPKISIRKSINLGIDLVGPLSKIFEPGKTDIEASIIVGSFGNFHFVAEGGILDFNMSVSDTIKSFDYTSSGKFCRLGFEFNTFKKNLPGENNYVLFGIRYGFSTMNHKADNIIITDLIWEDRYANFSEKNIFSQWIEFTGGLRIHLYKNIGAGWTARFKYMISPGGTGEVNPYYIPGFGKGADKLAVGFTYSLYYTLPIVKEKLD
jgi:hypothetical protein